VHDTIYSPCVSTTIEGGPDITFPFTASYGLNTSLGRRHVAGNGCSDMTGRIATNTGNEGFRTLPVAVANKKSKVTHTQLAMKRNIAPTIFEYFPLYCRRRNLIIKNNRICILQFTKQVSDESIKLAMQLQNMKKGRSHQGYCGI
jgi:hypothetical protein